MSELLPIIALGLGLVVGALAVWLILRAKAASAASEVRAEIEPALATLTERVSAKDQQITQLQSALQTNGLAGEVRILQLSRSSGTAGILQRVAGGNASSTLLVPNRADVVFG